MKYTIPYEDKITLPHIKKIETIGIDTQKLSYDSRELTGEVIVTGDYMLDNSEDLMEFTHDIPISFLIDDDSVAPEINISNFKYELIPGRGITVMFDLDVLLEREENDTEEVSKDEIVEENKEEIIRDEIVEEDIQEENDDEEIKEFQDKIDENLDKVLNNRKISEEKEIEQEDVIEVIEEEKEVEEEKEEERPIFKSKKEKKEKQEEVIEEIEEEAEELPLTQALEETYEEEFETNIKSTPSSFDTGFIPRDNEYYTTYKILLVEESENIDEILEARNLSKALICKEYQFNNKVVLKIEND